MSVTEWLVSWWPPARRRAREYEEGQSELERMVAFYVKELGRIVEPAKAQSPPERPVMQRVLEQIDEMAKSTLTAYSLLAGDPRLHEFLRTIEGRRTLEQCRLRVTEFWELSHVSLRELEAAIAAEEALAEHRRNTAVRLADARHAENRQLEQEVLAWWESHKHLPGMTRDKAATEMAGKVVPLAWRTVRDYLKGK